MILDRGYTGTSLEQIISTLELTKGAFFHHFNSKNDLARALIERFADEGGDTKSRHGRPPGKRGASAATAACRRRVHG